MTSIQPQLQQPSPDTPRIGGRSYAPYEPPEQFEYVRVGSVRRARWQGVFIGAVAVACLFAAGAAWAEPQCDTRDRVTAILTEKYGETIRAAGMSTGAVMELYASDATGTWTITATLPDGQMCMIGSGVGFVVPEAVAKGVPT